MGAAWRGPKERDLAPVLAMVREVKALGLETCCTLGMLKDGQAARSCEAAGLDYYNHNLDTAPEFYGEVDHDARLPGPARHARPRARRRHRRLLRRHRRDGRVAAQRAGLIAQLANMDPYPESVPINHLVQVEGTPLHDALRRRRGARSARIRAHDRRRADHDAEGDGAAVRGAARAGRRRAGAVLPRRRQFDLLRRQAADHRQPRRRRRPRAVREAGTDARRRDVSR